METENSAEVLGFLRNMSPYTVLKVIEQEGLSCVVEIEDREREHRGEVIFHGGEIVHAQTGDAEGEEALREILTWNDVQATLRRPLISPLPQTVHVGLDLLYLDVLKDLDETHKLIEENPVAEMEEIQGEVRRWVERITRTKQGGETMASAVERILEGLAGIAGFEGAAVISEEGLVLASRFVADVDEEKFAAFVQEAVTMAQNVIDTMGWGTLDNMAIESEDKHKLVLYRTKFGFVALIGNQSLNLGMARIKVDEAAEELEEEL